MQVVYYRNIFVEFQFPLAEVKKKLQEEKGRLRKMDPHAVEEDDEGI